MEKLSLNSHLTSNKTSLSKFYAATECNMAGEEAMVPNNTMMADVIAARIDDAIADPHERLDDVGFENEGIFPNVLCVDMRPRVDEGRELVTALLAFKMPVPPQLVELAVAERPQKLHRTRREMLLDFSPGDERQVLEAIARTEFCIYGEADDPVRAMRVKIDFCDLGDLSRAKDDYVCHAEVVPIAGVLHYWYSNYRATRLPTVRLSRHGEALRFEPFSPSSKSGASGGRFVSTSGKVYALGENFPDFTHPPELVGNDQSNRSDYSDTAASEAVTDMIFRTFGAEEEEIRGAAVDLLDLRQNFRVLETGAGTGRNSVVIAKRLGPKGSLHYQDLAVNAQSA